MSILISMCVCVWCVHACVWEWCVCACVQLTYWEVEAREIKHLILFIYSNIFLLLFCDFLPSVSTLCSYEERRGCRQLFIIITVVYRQDHNGCCHPHYLNQHWDYKVDPNSIPAMKLNKVIVTQYQQRNLIKYWRLLY